MPLLGRIGKRVALGMAAGTGVAVPPIGGAMVLAAGGAAAAKGGLWAMKNSTSPVAKAMFTVGGTAVFGAGVVSEVFNPDGPWGESSEFLSHVAKASISSTFATNDFQYNQGPLSYYEGGNVNPQALHQARNRRLRAPDGSMVMGMYNRRRG